MMAPVLWPACQPLAKALSGGLSDVALLRCTGLIQIANIRLDQKSGAVTLKNLLDFVIQGDTSRRNHGTRGHMRGIKIVTMAN